MLQEKKKNPFVIFLYVEFCFVETGFHVAQASLELLIRLHLGLDCGVTNVHWHLARNPSGLHPPLLPAAQFCSWLNWGHWVQTSYSC